MIGNNLTPETENVSIDMILINLNIPESMRQDIISRMHLYAAEHNEQPYTTKGYPLAVNLLYKPEYKYKRVLFCINTNNPNRPCLHLSFNPSGLAGEDLVLLRDNIRYLLGDFLFYKLYSEGKVSRLDIAFDIKNIIYEDLTFNRKLQRASGYYKARMDGMMGEMKLGEDTSKLQFRIYSKSNHRAGSFAYPVTRIEAEVKVNKVLRFITNIKNPFVGIGVYKLSHLLADKRLPVAVADSIFLRGLTAVLQLLKGDERKALEQLLTEHKIEIPPAEEVFGLWKTECDSFLELFRPPVQKGNVRSFSDLSPRKVAAKDIDEDMYYFHAEQRSCRINSVRYTYVEPYTVNKKAA